MGPYDLYKSAQIIATSHGCFWAPEKVVVWKGNQLISGKSRFVKYSSIWPDKWPCNWSTGVKF